MPAYYKIGDFAEMLGISIQTLRRWDKEGKLKPAKVTDGGTRLYSEYQYNRFIGKAICIKERSNILYCRVESGKQKDILEKQIENVKAYSYSRGYRFEIITDIGSGEDYTRKGLQRVIDKVMSGTVDKIVVLSKDILTSNSFELLSYVFDKYEASIEVVDNT